MDPRSDHIAAFRHGAITLLLLLLAIVVLSTYLIQRALLVLSSTLPALTAWSPLYQVSIAGLQFRYATMTVAWPLVLGGVALGFCAVRGRWTRMGRMLSGDARGLTDDELQALAPMALPETDALSTSGRFAVQLVALLPVAALVLHGAAGLGDYWVLRSHPHVWADEHASWPIFLGMGMLLATSALGISWCTRFMRALWPTGARPAHRDTAPRVPSPADTVLPEAVASRWQVFLSAKKLSADRRPTRDIEIAESLYEFLTEHDLRVFLSTRSLEEMGAASYKAAIDAALDEARILVAVGTSAENLESGWVRYEWDSFVNDIISDLKPGGCVFSCIEGMSPPELPRPLRQSEAFGNEDSERQRLLSFIRAALASPEGMAVARPPMRARRAHHSSFAGKSSLWRRPSGILLVIVVAALVIPPLWRFVTRPYGRSRMLSFLEGMRPPPAAQPFDTAWIFLGYIDPKTNVFIEGPYATVAFRVSSDQRGPILPQLGDVLRIGKDRRLVIADFRTKGNANEFVSPPIVHATLNEADFTGQVVNKGSLVIVRDAEISGEPGRPRSVWCRVRGCDPDTDNCRRAETESNP